MDVRRAAEPVIARPGKWRLALAHVHSKIAWERIVRRAVLPLVLLALWQYASTAGFFDPSFVPSPVSVVTSWWQWIFGPRSELAWYSGTWLNYVYLSAWRVLVGFAIASAVGVSVGVLIGSVALLPDLLDPIGQGLR